MPACKACRGTGLQPLLQPDLPELKRQHLFTENECQVCGGRGRKTKDDAPYDVQVFLNNQKFVKIAVMGESAADALVRSAELFEDTYATLARPGDILHLEILER